MAGTTLRPRLYGSVDCELGSCCWTTGYGYVLTEDGFVVHKSFAGRGNILVEFSCCEI